jgi:hypothetical protein
MSWVRTPVHPSESAASPLAIFSPYLFESRASRCGATSSSTSRAWSSSAFSTEFAEKPSILSGKTNTSPIESTKTVLPEAGPLISSRKSFQLLGTLGIIVVR